MANPFVHVELATTDLDKAKSFYRSLFSWQLEDVDMGSGMSYTMVGARGPVAA
jgi:predicted enzyme related to lactoylglutathione lyase